jgi:hypothetical protein
MLIKASSLSVCPGPRLSEREHHLRSFLVRRYSKSLNELDARQLSNLTAENVCYSSQAVSDVLRGKEIVLRYVEDKYATIKAHELKVWSCIGVVDHPLSASIPCVIAYEGEARQCLFVLHPNTCGEIQHIEILTVIPNPISAVVVEEPDGASSQPLTTS